MPGFLDQLGKMSAHAYGKKISAIELLTSLTDSELQELLDYLYEDVLITGEYENFR
jgi:hypothetical protein